MTFPQIPTPALFADEARLDANLAAMQNLCDAQGIELRPHVKTHKSIEIARRQLQLGAAGLTCAKLGEAEALLPAFEGQSRREIFREWNVPMLIHSSVLPSDIYSQASDILDIVQKWPDVRFNVAHSCRFDAPCLQRLSALVNCWSDVSAHGIHCELASQNNPIVAAPKRRFVSDYEDPAAVLRGLATAYPRKMLWGSDSPYHSFAACVEGENLALMSSFERESGFFHALPDALKSQVGWQNALDWLGVDVDV